MTIEQVYEESVRGLPRKEQLKLASLILKALTEIAESATYSDEWSDADMRELGAYSLQYAAEQYSEEDELV